MERRLEGTHNTVLCVSLSSLENSREVEKDSVVLSEYTCRETLKGACRWFGLQSMRRIEWGWLQYSAAARDQKGE